ncbi:nucleotide pyrophosphohydrolase [Mycobacterium tuberculosis]|nr:nucleotide pyrophosphohydrolase [Mycobacterium tuberculosis]
MRDLTVRQLEEYLLDHYQQSRTEEGLFIKLVEEVGEVAEVLNGRSGRKEGVQDSNEELAKDKGRTISAIRTIVYSVPTEDKKVRIVIDEK